MTFKISSIVLLSILLSGIVSAQKSDTTYFDKDWKQTKSANYSFYRTIATINGKLEVEDHYRSGALQMKGSYISLEPKEVEDGHFTYYTEQGVKTRDESFVKGLNEGDYLSYDTAGHLILKMNFKHDKWDGERIAFYPTGVVYRDEIYKDGNFVSGHVYDENGIEMKFFPRESLPEYPGGEAAMTEFIRTTLKYPEAASAKGIEGKVLVQFIVDTSGSVTNVVVKRSDNPLLNDAAIDLVRKMPKFKPAQQEGKLVRVPLSLPLNFRLTEEAKKKFMTKDH